MFSSRRTSQVVKMLHKTRKWSRSNLVPEKQVFMFQTYYRQTLRGLFNPHLYTFIVLKKNLNSIEIMIWLLMTRTEMVVLCYSHLLLPLVIYICFPLSQDDDIRTSHMM